jgi:hypothetical protein
LMTFEVLTAVSMLLVLPWVLAPWFRRSMPTFRKDMLISDWPLSLGFPSANIKKLSTSQICHFSPEYGDSIFLWNVSIVYKTIHLQNLSQHHPISLVYWLHFFCFFLAPYFYFLSQCTTLLIE